MKPSWLGWREIALTAIGAGGGLLFAPGGYGPLGGAIGAGVGLGLARVLGIPGPSRPMGRGDRVAYAVIIGLCLFMIGVAVRHWMLHPDQWIKTLLAVLTFGPGIALTWSTARRQGIDASDSAALARNFIASAMCAMVIAGAMLLFLPLGEYLAAIVGVGVFGSFALIGLWKGLRLRSRQGDRDRGTGTTLIER